jgi:Flp pilus assembly pilin Flp
MKNFLLKLVREDRGQDVIEYVLLAAGISIVAIVTIPLIGDEVILRYEEVLAALTAVAA